MIIFNEIKSLGKKPIVAKIGGFRPEKNIRSHFGGNFLIDRNQGWPKHGGSFMQPLIQIDVSELAGGREHFGDSKLIQVFLDVEELPSPSPCKNGEGWLLLEHKEIDHLSLYKTPTESDKLKTFQVKWEEHKEDDFPSWEEAWSYVDLSEINESEFLRNRFFDNFNQYKDTKIGGYPSYIQSPSGEELEYVFQIATEAKPNFMVADSGNLYLYKSKKDGNWYMSWDSY